MGSDPTLFPGYYQKTRQLRFSIMFMDQTSPDKLKKMNLLKLFVLFLYQMLEFQYRKIDLNGRFSIVVFKSSSNISAMISPLFCIRLCCSDSSLTSERILMFRESSLILAKVSMMAMVVCTACGLFRTPVKSSSRCCAFHRASSGQHIESLFSKCLGEGGGVLESIEPVEIFDQLFFFV